MPTTDTHPDEDVHVRPTRGLLSGRIGRGLAFAAGWTLVGCVFALPALTAEHWRLQLLGSLTQWWSWGLLAPAIVAVDRRLPWSGPRLLRRLPIQLVLSIVFTAIYVYVFAGLRAFVGLGTWSALFDANVLLSALRGMFLWSWLVYWLILGAWQAHHYSQRYLSSELHRARLEQQSADARLNALRMQLDPHFLFNALNAISSQVERDPALARDMIEHLGDLFRSSLESRGRHKVALSEELAFLDHYLAIQRIRFGDRLKVEIRIDPGARFALVPALILQPLVENAIRHGLSGRGSGGTVTISAGRFGDQLRLGVADDGVGLPVPWSLERDAGFGLSSTQERLAGLYPGRSATLSVAPRSAGGVVVLLTIPIEVSNDDERDV
jgi:signal transduction histidine kinase